MKKTIWLQKGVFLLVHHYVNTLDKLMYDVRLDSGMNQFDGMQASLMYEALSMSEPKRKLATTSIAWRHQFSQDTRHAKSSLDLSILISGR